MKTIQTIAALVMLTGAVLAGCAPTSPHWDAHFGEAQRMMMAQQVLNPDAGMQDVPNSLDGGAARESVIRYRNTFKEPPAPQNVFNIGVGTSGSGR